MRRATPMQMGFRLHDWCILLSLIGPVPCHRLLTLCASSPLQSTDTPYDQHQYPLLQGIWGLYGILQV